MKKLALAMFLVLLVAGATLAQSWTPISTNQMTVAWDAVTTLPDGSPLSAGDSIAYELVIQKLPDGEVQTLGRTTDLLYTVTATEEGEWRIGLITVRICADGTELLSDVNWSTENGELTPEPFSMVYRIAPGCAKNLRIAP